MIYYGLMVVTPELFLPIAFVVTLVVGVVLGSWGAAGTIGIAFLGIAAALNVPLGMAAGAIVAGAYVSEIISPLVDGPNLAAAIADCGVFALCKRFLVLCLVTCAGCTVVYLVIGMNLNLVGSTDVSGQVASLLTALDANYNIGPVTLIPLAVMIVCIALKVPAIPSFLVAIAFGMLEACTLQGSDLSTVVEVANLGVVSSTGSAELDALLSNGGIQEMMSTISIVVLVMAFGGIMQHTHLMDALVDPIVSRLRRFAQLVTATVFSGALFNVLLPDQYPDITLSTQMYSKEFRRRGVENEVWGNIVNWRALASPAPAAEHPCCKHGDGAGRPVSRLCAVRVLLLPVSAGHYRGGHVLQPEARLDFPARARRARSRRRAGGLPGRRDRRPKRVTNRRLA